MTLREKAAAGQRKQVQIRAQVLRDWEANVPLGSMSAFMPLSGDERGPDAPKQPRRGKWRQSDVTRAIAAAQEAELIRYRVEIDPGGEITIMVGGDGGDRQTMGLRKTESI